MSVSPRQQILLLWMFSCVCWVSTATPARAQVASTNPRFWATPARLTGLPGYEPVGRRREATPVPGSARVIADRAVSEWSATGPATRSVPGRAIVLDHHGMTDYTVLTQATEAVDDADAEPLPAPGVIAGPIPADGASCASCGGDAEWTVAGEACCGGPDCGGLVYGPCDPFGVCGAPVGLPFLTLRYTTFSFGVTGFKGAPNLTGDGSFGFHEGVNYASPIPVIPETGLGWQVGFRTVQSNLSGAAFTNQERHQTFFTTGVFRRVDWGLQGGVVFDLLRDEWYDSVDLGQVRGEISWKLPAKHEWGYWFAAGDRRDVSNSPLVNGQIDTWEPTNIHAFFYRRRFSCVTAAEGRLYAGFSDQSDGLLGADASIPINDRWLIRSAFTYLVPDQPTGAGGTQNEGWNIVLAGVWHFGRNAQVPPSRYTPLFDVADNGSFFVDQVGP